MADIVRYVNCASAGGNGTTNATSGASAAYASLSAWESAEQGSIANGDHHKVHCSRGSGGGDDTTFTVVAGWTMNTSGQLTIYGNRGDATGYYSGDLVQSPNHYLLKVTDGNHALRFDNVRCNVDGIQIQLTPGATAFRAGFEPNSLGPMVIENCSIRVDYNGSTQMGRTCVGHPGTSLDNRNGLTVRNCLLIGGNYGIEFRPAVHTTIIAEFFNNTVYGQATNGIFYTHSGAGGSTTKIRNNAVSNVTGSGTDISITDTSTSGSVTRSNNFTDDAAGGDSSIVSAASAWTSPGTATTSDFTVKDTSSALYNAGTATGAPTTDKRGTTRDATPDVGAYEFVAAGGGGGAMAGLASSTSNLVGVLKGSGKLAGLASSTSQTLGVLKATGRLVALIGATSQLTGTLSSFVPGGNLAGLISSTSHLDGVLKGSGKLSGLVFAVSYASLFLPGSSSPFELAPTGPLIARPISWLLNETRRTAGDAT